MRIRALHAILCVVACLAVIGMPAHSFAEEGDDPAAEAAKPEKIKGKLVSVSDTAIVVSIKAEDEGEPEKKTIALAPNVKVTLDKEAVKLADLPAKSKVTVTLNAEGQAVAVKAKSKSPKADEGGEKKKDKKPKDEGGDEDGGDDGE